MSTGPSFLALPREALAEVPQDTHKTTDVCAAVDVEAIGSLHQPNTHRAIGSARKVDAMVEGMAGQSWPMKFAASDAIAPVSCC